MIWAIPNLLWWHQFTRFNSPFFIPHCCSTSEVLSNEKKQLHDLLSACLQRSAASSIPRKKSPTRCWTPITTVKAAYNRTLAIIKLFSYREEVFPVCCLQVYVFPSVQTMKLHPSTWKRVCRRFVLLEVTQHAEVQ